MQRRLEPLCVFVVIAAVACHDGGARTTAVTDAPASSLPRAKDGDGSATSQATQPSPAPRAPGAGTVARLSSAGGSAASDPAGGAGGGAMMATAIAGAGGSAGQLGAAGQHSAPVAGQAAAVGATASAGSAAQSGDGAPTQPMTPSAGCAQRTPRPANGTFMTGDRIYTFPSAYDGATPMPLLLALHAAGNPNTQLQRITEGSRLETSFVRAFPKSAGSAWVYKTDVAKVNEVLDELLSEYCIDERRIFATGHSSGAQMIVQLLCQGEGRFRAVAPVAASKYCEQLPPTPVLYIQGQMDAQRGGGDGEDVVRVFRSGNACGGTSVPLTTVSSCTSTFDRKEVAPGCVTYDGCAQPTRWCSHNDNGYNNSDGRQHGWPCFANEAIAEFFLDFL